MSFIRVGRVDVMLIKRLEILVEVEKFVDLIGFNGEDVVYMCEIVGFFWKIYVLVKWEKFIVDFDVSDEKNFVETSFLFKDYFVLVLN